MSLVRQAIALAVLTLLPLTLEAQDSRGTRPSAEEHVQLLTKALDQLEATRDERAPSEAQRNELAAALAKTPPAAESSALVQRARVRLGELELHRGSWVAAERQFALVQEQGAASSPDLRGASLYGQALALEMRGEVNPARRLYERLDRDHAGTRYGDWAKVALARLASQTRGARAGQVVPKIASRLDVDGKPRNLATIPGAPVLVVFWSPLSQASLERLRDLAKVWQRTESKDRLLAIAARGDVDQILEVRKTWHFEFPMIACPARFLDPVLLDFAVASIPDAVLVAADGTIVARDPSPQKLAELVPELRVR